MISPYCCASESCCSQKSLPLLCAMIHSQLLGGGETEWRGNGTGQPAERPGANGSVPVINAVGLEHRRAALCDGLGQDVSRGVCLEMESSAVLGHMVRWVIWEGSGPSLRCAWAREVLTLYLLWPLNIRAIFRKFLCFLFFFFFNTFFPLQQSQ